MQESCEIHVRIGGGLECKTISRMNRQDSPVLYSISVVWFLDAVILVKLLFLLFTLLVLICLRIVFVSRNSRGWNNAEPDEDEDEEEMLSFLVGNWERLFDCIVWWWRCRGGHFCVPSTYFTCIAFIWDGCHALVHHAFSCNYGRNFCGGFMLPCIVWQGIIIYILPVIFFSVQSLNFTKSHDMTDSKHPHDCNVPCCVGVEGVMQMQRWETLALLRSSLHGKKTNSSLSASLSAVVFFSWITKACVLSCLVDMFVTEQEDKEWKVGQKTNSEHYHVFPVFLMLFFAEKKWEDLRLHFILADHVLRQWNERKTCDRHWEEWEMVTKHEAEKREQTHPWFQHLIRFTGSWGQREKETVLVMAVAVETRFQWRKEDGRKEAKKKGEKKTKWETKSKITSFGSYSFNCFYLISISSLFFLSLDSFLVELKQSLVLILIFSYGHEILFLVA